MRSVTLLAQRLSLPVLFVLVTLGCISTARADETVFTNPGWNGTSSICCIGYPNSATYGEVITAPTDGNTQLNSFQFYLNEPAGMTFSAYIAPWNGAYAGPLLYSGGPMVTAGTGFVSYTVSTGGVDLISNDQYVLFASISPYYALDAAIGAGYMGGDLASGGTSGTYFVWANNSGDFASLFTGSWASTGCVGSVCGQGAFVLDYSSPTVTPEVPTVVLFGTGLLGILFVMWKRVLT